MQEALDANATRGEHLRALIGKGVTLAAAAGAVVLAGGIGVALVGLAIGAAAAAGALLLALLVVWVIADSRAEEDFFEAYAAQRSLATGGGRGSLPNATGLLRQGVRSYTQRTFAGRLPGGLDGLLALYTYETEHTDSKGNRHTSYHHFTVVLAAVAGAKDFIHHLACQRRSGFRFLDSAEDVFRNRERVEVESEEFDRRFELFIGEGDDPNRARQLLSPTFVDWMASGNEDFAFELEGGILVCNLPGHLDSSKEFDEFCEAAAQVAERISTEARESGEVAAAASAFDPDSYVVEGTGKGSARLKQRLWGLVFLLALFVGLGIGFLSPSDDDGNGGSSGGSAQTPSVNYDSATLALQDGKLLSLIEEIDADGKGAHTDELWGNGLPREMVNQWITDAFVRDLIELDAQNQSFHLTAKGKRELNGG